MLRRNALGHTIPSLNSPLSPNSPACRVGLGYRGGSRLARGGGPRPTCEQQGEEALNEGRKHDPFRSPSPVAARSRAPKFPHLLSKALGKRAHSKEPGGPFRAVVSRAVPWSDAEPKPRWRGQQNGRGGLPSRSSASASKRSLARTLSSSAWPGVRRIRDELEFG